MDKRFPIIPSDRGDDLHHPEYAEVADLVLFMAGNQFMAMEELMVEFQSACPEVKKIFYETLPPGLELKQIMAGGAIFRGRTIRVRPDIYTAVKYYICRLSGCAHPENAQKFINFIQSSAARRIYRKYGFMWPD